MATATRTRKANTAYAIAHKNPDGTANLIMLDRKVSKRNESNVYFRPRAGVNGYGVLVLHALGDNSSVPDSLALVSIPVKGSVVQESEATVIGTLTAIPNHYDEDRTAYRGTVTIDGQEFHGNVEGIVNSKGKVCLTNKGGMYVTSWSPPEPDERKRTKQLQGKTNTDTAVQLDW